jgi:hypothetical protein
VPARSAARGAPVSGARSGDTPDPQNFRFEPVQVLLVRGGHEAGVALVVRNCIKRLPPVHESGIAAVLCDA